jgi:UDP-N-acetylmuramoylalanine--D-glutamate ligase
MAKGASVTVTDRKAESELAPVLSALPAGCRRELGGHREPTFRSADLIVLSPGVPNLAEIQTARRTGVQILGELELAARFVEAPLVAVTGTNGKSTTTALLGALLSGLGRPIFVGGNLGTPLSEAVGTPAAGAGGLCVIEVSSFQLETAVHFRARAAAVLNLTEDHLDRHGTMDAYAEAKARIFLNQEPSDLAVINGDDPWCLRLARRTVADVLEFSSSRSVEDGGFVCGGDLVLRGFGSEESYPVSELQIAGRHNQENALAALLIARGLGLAASPAREALRAFRPLPHRLEKVAEGRGVVFYDDSKATNVHSVVKALDGFPRPVVLIAGGRDKGGDYGPLREVAKKTVRAAVLIGEARPLIAEALRGSVPVHEAASLEEAVRQAAEIARPGDAVVLSPACASFDMFRNYEHRGDVFREAAAAWVG